MTIQSQFPASRPSLLLDFANAKRLDPRVTFTRASTARFYDGTTVAKAEENLLLQSQAFDQSPWTNSGATVTANTAIAPDGTTTADTLDNTSGGFGTYVYQVPTTVIGLSYVWSVFVKNDTATSSTFFVRTSTTAVTATIIWSGASITGSTSCTYVDVGNGWYRVIVPYTAVETAARHRIYPGNNSSTTGIMYLWGAQLEQRSSVTAYTPTTTAPITNYIPVLQTAASGQARFDHNPVTGESLGLLIEESRTNLVTYSDDFANAAWTKTRSSITSNTIIAPDGTLTGDKLVENTDTDTHFLRRTITLSVAPHTYSVYCKAGERSWVRVVDASVTNGGAYFNLSNGTIGTVGANAVASITSVGSGWYRCVITVTTLSNGDSFDIRTATANNTDNYTGDGYSGIYIWGAQLEAGAFPTSYIQTVAASATRQADAASMTGANFTSWYDQTEGTMYAEASGYVATTVANGNAAPTIASAWDALYRSINIFRNDSVGASNGAVTFTVIPFSTEASLSVTTANFNSGLVVRACGAYKLNDIAFSANGTAAITDTSCLLPVPSSFQIGRLGSTNTGYWNGAIRKVAYYPLRLTNAQLQALTG